MKIAICCLVLATISVSGLQAGTAPGLDAVQVASGLTQPLFVTAPPGDTGRLFIVQQNGEIRILNLTTGTLNSTAFLTSAATCLLASAILIRITTGLFKSEHIILGR